ncbi:hypothetical protein M0813_25981 [Anaeramoeba flamelloides]|uniref:NADAR domain-containing protein n=1 Tax=Anaeramoeba flamelloides TaxID=1746091 RepID=A0ABQ8Y2D9_9EUKA|nr:hypothetical protein M0813_25981 [Anaeramoeba flamelloides]
MNKKINFYNENENPYGCFSNYYFSPFYLEGKYWITSEHYFQAQKFIRYPEILEKVRRFLTPSKVKKFTNSQQMIHKHRNDWPRVKEEVMKRVLEAKFLQNERIKQILLSTGEKELIETTYNDRYWANGGDDTGLNRLGNLLMELRERIRQHESQQPIIIIWALDLGLYENIKTFFHQNGKQVFLISEMKELFHIISQKKNRVKLLLIEEKIQNFFNVSQNLSIIFSQKKLKRILITFRLSLKNKYSYETRNLKNGSNSSTMVQTFKTENDIIKFLFRRIDQDIQTNHDLVIFVSKKKFLFFEAIQTCKQANIIVEYTNNLNNLIWRLNSKQFKQYCIILDSEFDDLKKYVEKIQIVYGNVKIIIATFTEKQQSLIKNQKYSKKSISIITTIAQLIQTISKLTNILIDYYPIPKIGSLIKTNNFLNFDENQNYKNKKQNEIHNNNNHTNKRIIYKNTDTNNTSLQEKKTNLLLIYGKNYLNKKLINNIQSNYGIKILNFTEYMDFVWELPNALKNERNFIILSIPNKKKKKEIYNMIDKMGFNQPKVIIQNYDKNIFLQEIIECFH